MSQPRSDGGQKHLRCFGEEKKEETWRSSSWYGQGTCLWYVETTERWKHTTHTNTREGHEKAKEEEEEEKKKKRRRRREEERKNDGQLKRINQISVCVCERERYLVSWLSRGSINEPLFSLNANRGFICGLQDTHTHNDISTETRQR